jgi:formylglycine-generating enzyme
METAARQPKVSRNSRTFVRSRRHWITASVLGALILAGRGVFSSGKVVQDEDPSRPRAATIVNKLGMPLMLIPAGEYQMGETASPDELLKLLSPGLRKQFGEDELKKWFAAERPVHQVQISRPFYLGRYEVTKGQFKAFVIAASYVTDAERDGSKGGWGWDREKKEFARQSKFNWRDWGVDQIDDAPVVNVSWNDAVAFCEWMSREEKRVYRLPTEAEWEYACRAGTKDGYYSGNDPEDLTKVGNVADARMKEELPKRTDTLKSRDGFAFLAPVGKFTPNAFGLYDMHGNTMEWCKDWFDADYYKNAPIKDPQGPAVGRSRVIRGGSWRGFSIDCRSASRFHYGEPTLSSHSVGLRVACER